VVCQWVLLYVHCTPTKCEFTTIFKPFVKLNNGARRVIFIVMSVSGSTSGFQRVPQVPVKSMDFLCEYISMSTLKALLYKYENIHRERMSCQYISVHFL